MANGLIDIGNGLKQVFSLGQVPSDWLTPHIQASDPDYEQQGEQTIKMSAMMVGAVGGEAEAAGAGATTFSCPDVPPAEPESVAAPAPEETFTVYRATGHPDRTQVAYKWRGPGKLDDAPRFDRPGYVPVDYVDAYLHANGYNNEILSLSGSPNLLSSGGSQIIRYDIPIVYKPLFTWASNPLQDEYCVRGMMPDEYRVGEPFPNIGKGRR